MKKSANPNASGNRQDGTISASTRSMIGEMATNIYRYTVLYYKRKNKVHKSKGVSKLDGDLTFFERKSPPGSTTPPVSVTLRSSDTKAVVFNGGFRGSGSNAGGSNDDNSDDGVRSSCSYAFAVDQTISIGAYEVEILSRDNHVDNKNSSSNNSINNSSVGLKNNRNRMAASNRNVLNRGTRIVGRNSGTSIHRIGTKLGTDGNKKNSSSSSSIGVKTSNNVNRSNSSSIVRKGVIGIKRSLAGTVRKPPPQPLSLATHKKTKLSCSESDDSSDVDGDQRNDDDDDDDDKKRVPSSSSSSLLLSRRKMSNTLPGFKRPGMGTRRATPGIIHGHATTGGKVAPPVGTAMAKTATRRTAITTTATATTTRPQASQQPNIFPNAIGNLVVPNSIRTVLRPHQIEGVEFLWNCLTGNGQAANHLPPTSHRGGYSDSMNSDACDDDSSYSSDHEDGYGENSEKCSNKARRIKSVTSKLSLKGCILSDEMGLGKTLMTIATISALHRQKRTNRFIVVCPSSLVNNWAREFDKWLGKVGLPKRVVIRKGGEEGLRQIKAFNAVKPSNISEVLIVSYDLFRMKATILENIQRVALLVVDEGHRLKNTAGSLTMSALQSLPCEARLCITATPIQNNLGDMYTIVNFVCPGILGDLATFRKEYERPITAASKRNCTAEQKRKARKKSRILDGIIQSIMLRRLQKDILSKTLPPRHAFLLFCRPTLQQRELYQEVANCHTIGGPSQEHLTALMGLRKICTHPNLLVKRGEGSSGSGSGSMNCEASGKLSVLRKIVEEIREKAPTDKIVIVSNFTSTLTVVEDIILKPLQLNFLRLDGSVSSADRQSLVDTFNRTNADMNFALTLSSKAGGVGLNVIGANRLVMVDPDWNPATDIQAMARIYREGQKKTCFIYRCFTTGSIEEVILQKQIQKESIATSTVDRAHKSKDTGNGLNADELLDCFTLKDERCDCDTQKKMGIWPDYNGEASLIAQECADKVLQAVAAKGRNNASLLSFVHIVKAVEEEICRNSAGDGSYKGSKVNYDTDSDVEFEMEDVDDDSDNANNNHKADSTIASSSEEYEFE
uniref:Helicase ATP-binding domain-containing protein n=2 Tax=Pseudo-nitzschia australis TaxID=44445 RepID=A0A7S4AJZ2_9STRA